MVEGGNADEMSTDERTGMGSANKFKEGDLAKPINSYTGFGPGSTSIQDTKTPRPKGYTETGGPHRHTKEDPNGLHTHRENELMEEQNDT